MPFLSVNSLELKSNGPLLADVAEFLFTVSLLFDPTVILRIYSRK